MLFCREFRNVVNRAFLVLIFLVKNLAVLILRIFATMFSNDIYEQEHVILNSNAISQSFFFNLKSLFF